MRNLVTLTALFVVAAALSIEASTGSYATLVADVDLDIRGGGKCYKSLDQNDVQCDPTNDADTGDCGDIDCERLVNGNGGVSYECWKSFPIETVEVDGYKSKVNEDLKDGKNQKSSYEFFCWMHQNCHYGNNCTEETSNGQTNWRCINDGEPTPYGQEENHTAVGGVCSQ